MLKSVEKWIFFMYGLIQLNSHKYMTTDPQHNKKRVKLNCAAISTLFFYDFVDIDALQEKVIIAYRLPSEWDHLSIERLSIIERKIIEI